MVAPNTRFVLETGDGRRGMVWSDIVPGWEVGKSSKYLVLEDNLLTVFSAFGIGGLADDLDREFESAAKDSCVTLWL